MHTKQVPLEREREREAGVEVGWTFKDQHLIKVHNYILYII